MEDNQDLFEFETQDEPIQNPQEDQPEDIYTEDDFNGSENDQEPEEDFISKLLEAKGFKNKTIQITDENGELIDVNFDDLTDQEKFDLLSDQDQGVMPSDDELKAINFLRTNNMTLEDFAKWQREQGVQEYLANQTPSTEFDEYTDDEMIAYDFIQRFGEEMTDEEIDAEIDRLKTDPDAYKKRVDLLRASYKSEAEAQSKLYEQEQQTKSKAAEEAFKSAYVNAASGINYIHGMDLDENDKQELLDFVLNKDASNRTGLSKALDDPESVLRMAWYLLHAEDTFDATVDHFKKEISKRSRENNTRVLNRPKQNQSKDAFKF
jgi:hypothetical protein